LLSDRRSLAAITRLPFSFPFYVALALYLFRTAFPPTTQWIGGCCDPEEGIWFLRWNAYAVTHLGNPFFTTHLNYPSGVNLMWNASMPLAGFLLSPITLTAGPIAAYNLVLTLGVALSAWCAYLALCRFVPSRSAAVIGGAVYGFSPFVLSQGTQHLILTSVAVPPLLLLLLDEIIARRRAPQQLGLFLGLLATAQLLLSAELLATETLIGAITVVVLTVMYPSEVAPRARYTGNVLFIAIITFAVLSAAPLAMMLLGPQRLNGLPFSPAVYSTDLLNFVVPNQFQALAPPQAVLLSSHFSGLPQEATAYLGLPLILLLAYTVGRFWDRLTVRGAGIVGVIVAILSMGPQVTIAGQATTIPLPWSLVARLPLLADILPNRLTVFMYLCVAVLVAAFVDGLVTRWRWQTSVPGILLLALSLVFLLPENPYPVSSAAIPPIFTNWQQAGVAPGAVVLVAPRTEGGGDDQMLWQAVAGDAFRMPDGYALVPDPHGGTDELAPAATIFTSMDSVQLGGKMPSLTLPVRQAISHDLHVRNVDAVLVGPMPNGNLMVQFFTNLLGRQPENRGGVEMWRNVQRHGITLSRGVMSVTAVPRCERMDVPVRYTGRGTGSSVAHWIRCGSQLSPRCRLDD
jgi:hypothetical protein